MPMKSSLYPPDWPEIALREKVRAQWMCEQCGADCWDPISRQNILTVHHIDHNPANCDPDNLIALCAVCHLRADAVWHAHNAAITRAVKRAGQIVFNCLLFV
jgi:NAD-dependent dihydropyrimidine dehydrogenase PreA subunit